MEYIAFPEDDQMRQEFEEEAAQGTEAELQGLFFLSPLRRAPAAAAAATTSAKARTEGERQGLRQVSLREDNNRGAISERTKGWALENLKC